MPAPSIHKLCKSVSTLLARWRMLFPLPNLFSNCPRCGMHDIPSAFSRSEIDQETAKLESQTFVQKQKVELASELKGVLDSWVRFEQQQKESEQADLTKAVVNKVLENLKESKTQQELLASAITEVERKSHLLNVSVFLKYYTLMLMYRTRQEQGHLMVDCTVISWIINRLYLLVRAFWFQCYPVCHSAISWTDRVLLMCQQTLNASISHLVMVSTMPTSCSSNKLKKNWVFRAGPVICVFSPNLKKLIWEFFIGSSRLLLWKITPVTKWRLVPSNYYNHMSFYLYF